MNLRDPVKRANKRLTMVIPSYTTQLTTVEYIFWPLPKRVSNREKLKLVASQTAWNQAEESDLRLVYAKTNTRIGLTQILDNIGSIHSWIAMLELYTKTEYYNNIVPLIKWYHKHQVDCWPTVGTKA